MSSEKRVVVGMSGGVDSTVTVALLREQGYVVEGAMMTIWDGALSFDVKQANACYGPNEAHKVAKARALAGRLGVPFHVVDLAPRYRSEVLDYFRDEYLRGRTPNPCVVCNHRLKFSALWEGLMALGVRADHFATGHYVQKVLLENGRVALKKGVDPKKDQSYFLFALSQEQLTRTLFPLGGMVKDQVRARAAELELGFERVKESQNFVTGGYEVLFDGQESPGDIVDVSGQLLGTHDGIWRYTVGQRKGIGVSAPYPLYVVGVDAPANRVVVGRKELLYSHRFTVTQVNWMALERLASPMEVVVKIRYQHQGALATITPMDDEVVQVTFEAPQLSITPGQVAVFYADGVLLGGGFIDQVATSA